MNWSTVKSLSLPNLHVLSSHGVELGFMYKPHDTKTDKCAWVLFRGIGDKSKFIGHDFNKKLAKEKVESFFK